jgi:hypothetical protein
VKTRIIDQLLPKRVAVVQECTAATELPLMMEETPATSKAGERRRPEMIRKLFLTGLLKAGLPE